MRLRKTTTDKHVTQGPNKKQMVVANKNKLR